MLQIFQTTEQIKEKKKLIGKNTLTLYDEANERLSRFEDIPFVHPYECKNYKEFLDRNLLENIERSIQPIFEVYTSAIQNLNLRKIDLKSKTGVQDNVFCIKSKISFEWYKFTPSSISLASLDGLNMLIPAYSSLVEEIAGCSDRDHSQNNTTKSVILKSWKNFNICSYLLEIVKFYKNSFELGNYRIYLIHSKNIDAILELLYRSLFEHLELPSNFWQASSVQSHFFYKVPFLFYIDWMKLLIFKIFNQNDDYKQLLLTSDAYTNTASCNLNQSTRVARDFIVRMILESRDPNLKLGLIFDLYFRFKEYLFLREILTKLIDYGTDTKNVYEKYSNMIDYLFRLIIKYIDEVDMNLSVIKSVPQIERYIRIIDLLNTECVDADPILIYIIVDKIYSKLKVIQFEKPFKQKARSGSFSIAQNKSKDQLEYEPPELILSDNDEDSWEFEAPTKSLSIILQSRGVALDLMDESQPK